MVMGTFPFTCRLEDLKLQPETTAAVPSAGCKDYTRSGLPSAGHGAWDMKALPKTG